MKRLNKLIAVALSLFALLTVSTVTSAGMDSEVLTIAANTDATPSAVRPPPPPPPPPSSFVKCKVGKKTGVLCSDGFCDTSGGRNPKNLCKGHGGVASPH